MNLSTDAFELQSRSAGGSLGVPSALVPQS
eukprot:SAG11_NODE_49584_length_117_cov_320.388889_1_plen_29_part_10